MPAATLPLVVAAGDPGSSRLVYAMVIGLVLVGIAFIVLAVWLIRQTRYDPPVLAPLERMGDKDWRRQSDPATQRRILDEVRPEGAEPLRSESSPPSLDAEFELADRPVASMSDLAPPVAEDRSATPHGLDRPDLLDYDLEPQRAPEPEPGGTPESGVPEPFDGPVEGPDGTPEGKEPNDAEEPVEEPVEESEELSAATPEGPVDDVADESPVDGSTGEAPSEPVDLPADGEAQGSTEVAER